MREAISFLIVAPIYLDNVDVAVHRVDRVQRIAILALQLSHNRLVAVGNSDGQVVDSLRTPSSRVFQFLLPSLGSLAFDVAHIHSRPDVIGHRL